VAATIKATIIPVLMDILPSTSYCAMQLAITTLPRTRPTTPRASLPPFCKARAFPHV
jgi:hypothetical protein